MLSMELYRERLSASSMAPHICCLVILPHNCRDKLLLNPGDNLLVSDLSLDRFDVLVECGLTEEHDVMALVVITMLEELVIVPVRPKVLEIMIAARSQ